MHNEKWIIIFWQEYRFLWLNNKSSITWVDQSLLPASNWPWVEASVLEKWYRAGRVLGLAIPSQSLAYSYTGGLFFFFLSSEYYYFPKHWDLIFKGELQQGWRWGGKGGVFFFSLSDTVISWRKAFGVRQTWLQITVSLFWFGIPIKWND